MSSSSVPTTLYYYSPPVDGSEPWSSLTPDETGKLPRNWEKVPHTVEIESIRGKEAEYSLDTTGFTLTKRASKHTRFDNDDDIKAEYYPESIDLIKEVTGASRVVFFDHTVRHNNGGPDTVDNRQPVTLVHVDQTDKAAEKRVRRHLPEGDVEELLKHRYQIINLWRPVGYAADEFPLALCDFRSVDTANDFQATKLLYPNPPHGETMGVKFNPNHRWKYVKGMQPDEAVLIKCFDSQRDVARFTPHTAFVDPTTPKDALPRQSIELRALVFYD